MRRPRCRFRRRLQLSLCAVVLYTATRTSALRLSGEEDALENRSGDPNSSREEALKFNCNVVKCDWADWSMKKKEWCCRVQSVACEIYCGGLLEGPHGWTEAKKDWCCVVKQLGCPVEEFDCNSGLEEWEINWSTKKKEWCCKHKQVGCSEKNKDRTKNKKGVVNASLVDTADESNDKGAADQPPIDDELYHDISHHFVRDDELHDYYHYEINPDDHMAVYNVAPYTVVHHYDYGHHDYHASLLSQPDDEHYDALLADDVEDHQDADSAPRHEVHEVHHSAVPHPRGDEAHPFDDPEVPEVSQDGPGPVDDPEVNEVQHNDGLLDDGRQDEAPHDCQAELATFLVAWSEEKKDWCCENEGLGCGS